MGVIMAVVAVFETHIERKAVASITASTSNRAEAPSRAIIQSAIRRSMSYFWSAFASMKPAMKRKMNGSAKPASAGSSEG